MNNTVSGRRRFEATWLILLEHLTFQQNTDNYSHLMVAAMSRSVRQGNNFSPVVSEQMNDSYRSTTTWYLQLQVKSPQFLSGRT